MKKHECIILHRDAKFIGYDKWMVYKTDNENVYTANESLENYLQFISKDLKRMITNIKTNYNNEYVGIRLKVIMDLENMTLKCYEEQKLKFIKDYFNNMSEKELKKYDIKILKRKSI